MSTINTWMNLNSDSVVSMKSWISLENEQGQIAIFLDRKLKKHAIQNARVRDCIEKLHGYRTVLISSAMMSTIDVREEAM